MNARAIAFHLLFPALFTLAGCRNPTIPDTHASPDNAGGAEVLDICEAVFRAVVRGDASPFLEPHYMSIDDLEDRQYSGGYTRDELVEKHRSCINAIRGSILQVRDIGVLHGIQWDAARLDHVAARLSLRDLDEVEEIPGDRRGWHYSLHIKSGQVGITLLFKVWKTPDRVYLFLPVVAETFETGSDEHRLLSQWQCGFRKQDDLEASPVAIRCLVSRRYLEAGGIPANIEYRVPNTWILSHGSPYGDGHSVRVEFDEKSGLITRIVVGETAFCSKTGPADERE